MRGPSRQTTARLTAGGFGRAAMARARSDTIRPSAPSATLAKVSARPGASSAAEIWPAASCALIHGSEGLDALEQRARMFRRQGRVADQRGIEIGIGHLDQALQCAQFFGRKGCNLGIGKAAEDQVHLARSAVPAAKQ